MSDLSFTNHPGQETLVIRTVPNYSRLRMGNMTLNCAAFVLSTPNGALLLTRRESRILERMMTSPYNRITVEMLCETVRDSDEQVDEAAIWSDLFYLRQKLIVIRADFQIRVDSCIGFRLEKIK